MTTGGELLVKCLEAQGTDRLFCVPGESYLAVLDALHGSTIESVVARQEGGAAMMAEADAKLTGRPGVCFVTRGPGATNAASGIHVAQQDSTPLVLFVGQVGRNMAGRDAFQEVDFTTVFGGICKLVLQIEDANRIPEFVSRAFATALSGRPGPVVVALPEDMLREQANTLPGPMVFAADPAPTSAQIGLARQMIAEAAKPFLVLGGSSWNAETVRDVAAWSSALGIATAVSFRRQQLMRPDSPNYAGDLGLGANPDLLRAIEESDLVVLLGARMSEIPSQNFTLLGIPQPRQQLLHILPGAEELYRTYAPTLAINATPATFLSAWGPVDTIPGPATRVAALHASFLNWSTPAARQTRFVDMGLLVGHMSTVLPQDAIITNGAGNYSAWLHRYYRYRDYGSQVAPTSGSMGYGLPAAVAAKLRHPNRPVICLAGDGCFQMTCQELGTAAQQGANLIVIVIDNGTYGTIRMHQERHYPTRVSATELRNPDFVKLAEAYGFFAQFVDTTAAFRPALEAALHEVATQSRPALIHVRTDPEVISPTTTITELRAG